MQRVFVRSASVRTSWSDETKSLTDLIFDCVSGCLRRDAIDAPALGAVVLAAHDLVDGRGLTNMVTAPAAAAYLKDEIRLADDGATAFILADARVRSGSVETCLVASWGRASEGPCDAISHALFDPFTAQPLGMTEIAVSALRANLSLVTFSEYREHRAGARRRRAHPVDQTRMPPKVWPFEDAELPQWADVVAVAVLSARPSATEVLGVGLSTEPYEIGDRDLLELPALRSASSQALRMAGLSIDDIDVLELDGLTMFDDALAIEAVGAARAGGGMSLLHESSRANPGGGSAAGYCAPAMGLVRVVSAHERLTAGGNRALASGCSVVAAQTQAGVVLGRQADS